MNENNIISFDKRKDEKEAKNVLSVLTDFEIDEALNVLVSLKKKEKDMAKKENLEEEFWSIVCNAWARERE